MTGRPNSNTNNTLQTANNPVFMSNTWTGLVFFIQPTIGADSSLFQSATGPGTNDRSLGVNSSGALVGYLFDGGAKSATDPVALTAGNPYVACAASDGSSIQVWKNGVLAASTASANGGYTGYGASGPFCVMGAGFGPSSGTAGSSARIALLAWWSRALSAAEHRALAENPWQLLTLRSGVQSMLMRSAFPAAAAGAGASARPRVFVCT
jgi:hypothetical protein